jgi:two-component system, sensor histidine kinase and response regulator
MSNQTVASILVVDDTPDNLRLLSKLLAGYGYRVRVANSGLHALESVRTNPPDLILLDIMMAGMDGYQVCQQVKADSVTRDIPIIFISALDDVADKVTAFTAGGVDYITKPFRDQEVLARIQTHLMLRDLQKQLQIANGNLAIRVEEVEARNAELDAFAHTVAHDLKNPIGLVLGYAELLQSDAVTLTPAEVESYAGCIVKGARKLNDIIEGLLVLARARQQAVDFKPLDMGSIVAETQQRLLKMIEEYRPEICAPAVSAWPVAVGYAPWIEEVWANYLSNAMKYGGQPPRLELGADLLGDERQVRFWVRDNGPGLSPEDQARLFTPFVRIHTARAEGHGLGLSIVQRIIERQNGQVGVESALGQGSRFFFTLPVA